MKALLATVVSAILTAVVIGNAYIQKKQFYPLVVYLTNSNPSMAVLYIQAFILVMLMGKLMRKIFFGSLRAAEFEHLMERSWYAITETCLAFTVFRDDFNPKFIALFTVLLFLKAFHWLAEDRVDYMERSPVIGGLFHARILSLLVILAHLDCYFILHAYNVTMNKGPSVQLVFGFEYAILIIMIVNIFVKYLLHAIDSYWEAPWENKAAVLLYTELAISFLKVVLYISFVAVMIRTYTLPLFAFRPMYYTMRSFKNAFNDVVLSRRAIRNMNTLYPDATASELAAVDNVCIICREEMHTGAKKLPCNHIFHSACLRSWFQRQQTCPTCRLNVLRTPTPPQPTPPPFAGQQQQFVGVQQMFAGAAAPPHFGGIQQNANPNNNAAQNNPETNIPQHIPTSSFLNFVMPPPPPLFTLAPPPIPQNLAPLSIEQLEQLEGRERKNIEARIKLLREIQTLLDASTILMQQYHTVAPSCLNSATQTMVEDFAAPHIVKVETKPESSDKPGTSGITSQLPAGSVFSKLIKTESSDNRIEESSATPNISSSPLDAETEELRRRRLQKFTSDT